MPIHPVLRRPGRPLRPTRRTVGGGGLAALVIVGQLLGTIPVQAAGLRAAAAPPAPRAADDPAPAGDPAGEPAAGELQPGVQYEEAMAHAADRIEFTPGGKVTVGFRPRADDTWQVGGRAPRALPAGTASGRDLRLSTPGAVPPPEASPDAPAEAPADTPVDAPTEDRSELPAADDASARMPLATDEVALDGTRLRRQVMGFLPYWEVSDAVLDYELLSTIAYFSVGSDKNGNLLKLDPDGTPTTGWGGWTSSRMTSIINGAHQKGTRVVLTISVFAWTSGQAALQGALLGNPTARLNLARQAAAAVRARGADGINLDFEPIASGYAEEFTALVRTVRAELDKQASGYQLTFDTTGFIGNYPLEAATAPGGADAIFIMGYDYRTSGSAYAGSIDPAAGPAYDLEDTINAYAARVSPSKLILGTPWYGRAWSTVSDQVNAKTQSGTKYGTSNTVILDTALDYAKQYGRRWDSRELSAWTAYRKQNCSSTYGCVMTWRQVYFDDAQAAKARYDMIIRKGLRGVGIWALGYDVDRIEMRQALAEKFLDDKTAPVAGVRRLAPSQSTETFTVSWTGIDESGVRDYDVQVSIEGGPWLDWLTKTTALSMPYFGASGHGFAFRVRARDVHGNASAWDVGSVYHASPSLTVGGFGSVVSSDLNVRSAPDTSAAVVTTVDAGTLLSITGGPVGADGFTWYEVTVPISEWAPIGGVHRGVWVAVGNASTTLVKAATAPNATYVVGGLAKPVGARFVGLQPTRLVDTRSGLGLSGPFTSGAARTFALAGRGGIPSNAIAVTGSVAVVGQTSAGYLTMGPFAATLLRSSVVNAPVGDVRAAGFTVALAGSGPVAAMWMGAGGSKAHVVIDVTGYFVPGSSGSRFVPLTPARVVDTRFGTGLTGPFPSSTPRTFQVSGRGGVPSGATAVTGNLVAVDPNSSGYLALGPTVSVTPSASSLNTRAGDTRGASVTMPLDGSGRLALVWKGTPGSRTHVVFDVTGYFTASGAGATYFPIDSSRVLDTRFANGLSGPFGSKVLRVLQANGRGAVPLDAVAVTGGAAAIIPTGAGWLIVGPGGSPLGTTATINVPKGDIRANGFTSRAGVAGTLGMVFHGPSGSSAHVVLDITGYFR
ncbi:MAG TPA: glycosyl hydrolase family 18 protein [Candidatus Limnocylindrales bacterium]|nr:glycosyl hydrolase family 18 protein [Candidatus Limnocylindrales bacterium]